MRILQITPGAGEGFYCENCLRDAAAVRALRRLGHDALMVPLYLPPLAEAPGDVPDTPIFFGGVNVYLQQRFALFRRTPRWLDRVFDSPRLLRWAGRMAGMTRAEDLGEPTLSMLRGEHGRQRKELDRLLDWMRTRGQPDVVVLSNALLAGLVRPIHRLGAPVVCMLQDEEGFLDALPAPYARQCWDLLTEIAAEIDALVAVSRFYADRMRRRLGLPDDRVHAVYCGVDPAGYGPAAPPETPTVGFLSQMSRANGLDALVEAFVTLKTARGLGGLKLRAAGGKTRADEALLREVRGRIDAAGLADHVELLDDLDRPAKIDFLRSLSVLSVPARRPAAFALFALEALACGVPVVLPRHGAFAEIVEATGGGALVEPDDPAALADALEQVLADPPAARATGRRGRDAVLQEFTVERTARELVQIFETLTRKRPR